MLHHLVNEYNNFRSLIADSNMIESNETRACQIKKPENNPQPHHYPFYKHRYQDCNSYGHKVGFRKSSQRRPYTDHRCGRFQNQHRQSHGVLTTMQVNVSRRRYVTFCINGEHIKLQVDTGSDITIASREAWKSLGRPKLDKVPFKVSSASGDAVQLSGVMKCEATFKDKAVATVCYVADRGINPVGLD
ncbi:unnamed protein product [Hymenolepis diminuta]|uniref:Peptidase A2 domain-containing protein n=1 Tax=Hymenolepis diminuta TaxID=6216 RepID=A0A564Y3C9_HYMDI|nr:unnamed protein product [Hymenolepis diminuta]